jgi:hypothetical protein
MLNGAFAIGTPDSVTHMAEELPYPRKDLPRAIAAQIILGTLSGSHSLPLRALKLTFVMFSGIYLRGHAHVRHHRPRCSPHLERVLSPRCGLCPSDGKQGRHIRSVVYCVCVDYDMLYRSIHHRELCTSWSINLEGTDMLVFRPDASTGRWHATMSLRFPLSLVKHRQDLVVPYPPPCSAVGICFFLPSG